MHVCECMYVHVCTYGCKYESGYIIIIIIYACVSVHTYIIHYNTIM